MAIGGIQVPPQHRFPVLTLRIYSLYILGQPSKAPLSVYHTSDSTIMNNSRTQGHRQTRTSRGHTGLPRHVSLCYRVGTSVGWTEIKHIVRAVIERGEVIELASEHILLPNIHKSNLVLSTKPKSREHNVVKKCHKRRENPRPKTTLRRQTSPPPPPLMRNAHPTQQDPSVVGL
ncbi:hypothetical protein BDW22DRAFT_1345209 [Trametopsis cervina]|nr:hypothetical protein BDW22DRAFT_1345209 [Trametopsis cervina]